MSFLPVFAALGESERLLIFNLLLDKLTAEAEIGRDDAAELLGFALQPARARTLLGELYGDRGLDSANVFKLWLKLFPKGVTQTQGRLLNKPLAQLQSADKSRLELPLAGLAGNLGDPPANSVDLLLRTEADLQLSIQGMATPPAAAEPEPDLVRLGFTGTFGGMTAAGFSVSPWELHATAGGDYRHSVGYYLRGSPEQTLGQAAMQGLALLGRHPALKVQSLLRLLSAPNRRFEAVELQSRQEWRFRSRVRLAKQLGLGEGAGLDTGIDLDMQLIEHGEFRLRMTAAGDELEVAIRRLERRETKRGSAFTAEFDLTGLGQRLYPRLRHNLGRAGQALGRLLELLPETAVVRTTLRGAVARALADFEYRNQLLAVIGPDPTVDPGERMVGRMLELIERSPDLWMDKTTATAEAIVERLLDELGDLTPEVRAALKQALLLRVRGALGELDQRLRERVREALLGVSFEELDQALAALGERVGARLDRLDRRVNDVTRKLRRHVSRYQGFVARLGQRLEQAADYRVRLRAHAEQQRLRSEQAEIRLRFDPNAPEADDLFRRLLLSDVAGVFRAALEGERDGPVRAIGKAALSRYARLTRSSAYEAVLFGFEIGGQSILDVETQMVEDAAGNLTIVPRMRYSELINSLSDRRRFHFVNVYQLAGARRVGTASLAFSVYREAAGLETGQITAFVDSAAQLGMISAADRAALPEVLERLPAEGLARARINLGLTLTESQLQKLLTYGAPVEREDQIASVMTRICRPTPPDEDRELREDDEWSELQNPGRAAVAESRAAIRPRRMERVVEITCQAFDQVVQIVPPTEPRPQDLHRLLRQCGYGGGIGGAIRDYESINFFAETATEGFAEFQDNRAVDWLYYRHKAVTEFAGRALLGMWAIYHSGPYNWEVERYNRCQERSAEILGYWFDRAGSQLWAAGLQDEIRPVTLALLKTLLTLADTDPAAPGPVLAMDLQLLDEQGAVAQRLPISA